MLGLCDSCLWSVVSEKQVSFSVNRTAPVRAGSAGVLVQKRSLPHLRVLRQGPLWAGGGQEPCLTSSSLLLPTNTLILP